MARQRTLKPTFFTNEDLGECSPLARLFFAGLWCWADREGYVEDRPKRLRAEILPYDQVEGEQLVAELVSRGLLERLDVAGTRVIRIVNFLKHQDPHPREVASRFAQGSPRADLGSPRANLSMDEQGTSPASPSSPSQPSRPSQPASPPNPQPSGGLASVPGWLAGVQEVLSHEFGKPVSVGKDPAAVVEAFENRLRHLREVEGHPEPEQAIVGDCLEVARRSKAGTPSTLSFFVGWFNRVTPQRKATP